MPPRYVVFYDNSPSNFLIVDGWTWGLYRPDRGDVDKRCQIDVGLRPRSVRVEHTDADLFVALDCAADRASRSVARALEREREWEESPRSTADYRRVTS